MVVGCVVVVTVLVVLASGVAGMSTIADVTEATGSAAANVLGHTLELVVALLTAGENTALVLELVQGHGGQCSSVVVGRLVMVDLVDGDSGVDHVGLDDFPIDNGLNGLVDVLERC